MNIAKLPALGLPAVYGSDDQRGARYRKTPVPVRLLPLAQTDCLTRLLLIGARASRPPRWRLRKVSGEDF